MQNPHNKYGRNPNLIPRCFTEEEMARGRAALRRRQEAIRTDPKARRLYVLERRGDYWKTEMKELWAQYWENRARADKRRQEREQAL